VLSRVAVAYVGAPSGGFKREPMPSDVPYRRRRRSRSRSTGCLPWGWVRTHGSRCLSSRSSGRDSSSSARWGMSSTRGWAGRAMSADRLSARAAQRLSPTPGAGPPRGSSIYRGLPHHGSGLRESVLRGCSLSTPLAPEARLSATADRPREQWAAGRPAGRGRPVSRRSSGLDLRFRCSSRGGRLAAAGKDARSSRNTGVSCVPTRRLRVVPPSPPSGRLAP
jgi:hypothetical protein